MRARGGIDTTLSEGRLEDDVLPDACPVKCTQLSERVRVTSEERLKQSLSCTTVRVSRSCVDIKEQGSASMERDQFAEAIVGLLLFLASCACVSRDLHR